MSNEVKKCYINECDNKVYCKGLCRRHYDKFRNYGDPLYRTKNDLNDIKIFEDYAEIILRIRAGILGYLYPR